MNPGREAFPRISKLSRGFRPREHPSASDAVATERNRRTTMNHKIVSRAEWLEARTKLLAREMAWVRYRDEYRT